MQSLSTLSFFQRSSGTAVPPSRSFSFQGFSVPYFRLLFLRDSLSRGETGGGKRERTRNAGRVVQRRGIIERPDDDFKRDSQRCLRCNRFSVTAAVTILHGLFRRFGITYKEFEPNFFYMKSPCRLYRTPILCATVNTFQRSSR